MIPLNQNTVSPKGIFPLTEILANKKSIRFRGRGGGGRLRIANRSFNALLDENRWHLGNKFRLWFTWLCVKCKEARTMPSRLVYPFLNHEKRKQTMLCKVIRYMIKREICRSFLPGKNTRRSQFKRISDKVGNKRTKINYSTNKNWWLTLAHRFI